MEYDLLPSKIWIRLKKCKNENDDWWKMASWPPWANEAWDRQRRADGQGGSWVGGYISPNLGYISLNMDIYFNCEYISFNHGKSLKWEYISLHLIYSSRNFGYISLHAPLWDVSLITCISFLLPAKSIIHHICTEGWVRIGLGTIWKIQ